VDIDTSEQRSNEAAAYATASARCRCVVHAKRVPLAAGKNEMKKSRRSDDRDIAAGAILIPPDAEPVKNRGTGDRYLSAWGPNGLASHGACMTPWHTRSFKK
jgi:hypothetical protein